MANTSKSQADQAKAQNVKTSETSENRDPLSGEPGAHPVGVGVGAAAGGAAAGVLGGAMAGAMGGTAAGPIGTAIGAVVGGVAGGLAGKSVAEAIDPTTEDAYWRENYSNRSNIPAGSSYDEYRPAYQYGWESRSRYNTGKFEDYENDLGRDWDRSEASRKLPWERAKGAARDAWTRIDERIGSAEMTDPGLDPTIPGTCDNKNRV